jgi:hypothetical protein
MASPSDKRSQQPTEQPAREWKVVPPVHVDEVLAHPDRFIPGEIWLGDEHVYRNPELDKLGVPKDLHSRLPPEAELAAIRESEAAKTVIDKAEERLAECEERLTRAHNAWAACREAAPAEDVLDAYLGKGPGAWLLQDFYRRHDDVDAAEEAYSAAWRSP